MNWPYELAFFYKDMNLGVGTSDIIVVGGEDPLDLL